jgi:hypothetical protein
MLETRGLTECAAGGKPRNWFQDEITCYGVLFSARAPMFFGDKGDRYQSYATDAARYTVGR